MFLGNWKYFAGNAFHTADNQPENEMKIYNEKYKTRFLKYTRNAGETQKTLTSGVRVSLKWRRQSAFLSFIFSSIMTIINSTM